ncbi:coxsackievirus and adenovirus receptor homolog isoform X2 [Mastacembelus armatus]|uniref:coxsackievirus and adenovirus receptor homolog isoform X2 n=1 Tax=Mastacembelus armatus TaxID=205130 RepID=UPI000E459B7E|nr:coxsackievirus and adenovirus receptor homolog isoform X2 [Mastacembelus armatus]
MSACVTWMVSVGLIGSSVLGPVYGDPEQIEAKPGENVTLQCRGPKDDEIVMLRWVRPDLKSGGYVFYFRENRRNEDHQYESFHGRVDLRDPEMKDGDFSVILKKVRISDTGSYECYVGIKGNKPKLINNMSLKVEYPDITAEPGQTVTLPCRAPSSSEIRTVEWTRPDLDPEEIFVYLDRRFDPDNQHPSFKERVELKDSQMKDGDVSVTLKDVTFTDTGTYECRVFQGQSKAPELTSIFHLRVSAGHGHVGLAVGLTVVGILLLVAAVVGFMFYRKRSRPTDQNPNPRPEQTPMNPKGTGSDQLGSGPAAVRDQSNTVSPES